MSKKDERLGRPRRKDAKRKRRGADSTHVEELEPRILLSTVTLQDLGTSDAVEVVEQRLRSDEIEQLASPTLLSSGSDPSDEVRHELVFVDDSVEDYDQLLIELLGSDRGSRQIEAILISSDRDGLSQITAALADREDIDAIHILAHGADGKIELGNGVLDAETLVSRSDEISGWSRSLDADADLLFYGCDLAATDSGRDFVERIATLTQADVSASEDPTGASALGGDWDLEYRTGKIESELVSAESWQHVLPSASPIGRWTFDSDATDSSGNNYNGVLTNQAAIDTADATDNLGEGKLSLDGSDDYVDLSAHVGDFSGFTEGTISGWVNTSVATAGSNVVLSVSDSLSGGDYLFFGIRNGQIRAEAATTSSGVLYSVESTNVVVNDGAWHHLAMTVDATGNRFYVDGVESLPGDLNYLAGSASDTEFFADIPGLDAMNVGILERAGPQLDYQGLIDDVRVYDQALAASDISKLATGQSVVVAVADAYVTPEDTPLVFDPTVNDTDVDGDAIIVAEFTQPTNGAVVDNGDGTLTYTPDPGYTGADSFEYKAIDAGAGLTNYWGLDGNALDAIGGANGTLNGTTTVPADFGLGLDFDDTNDDYVTIPGVSYAAEFTISFDFKIDDNSGTLFQYLYSHGDINAANSINIFINEDAHGTDPGVLRTVIRDANDTLDNAALQVDINTLVGDSQWHTYTATAGANGIEVFIDGVSVASDATRATDGIGPAGNLYLGTREDTDLDRRYGGGLDSVQLYDNALSGTQVADLASAVNQATVNITVSADAVPVITSDGGAATANINVTENTTAVTTVTATDPDLDTLTYSIDPGSDDAALFTIDSGTGALTFLVAPDFEAPADLDADNVYEVTVEVDDGKGGVDTQALSVTITNSSPTTITATGASSVDAGLVYTLNLSANEDVTSWTIGWGDGTIETIAGNPSSVTHTYGAGHAGLTFNILASASDADGEHFVSDLVAPTAFLTGEGLYRYSGSDGSFTQVFSGAELTNPYAVIVGPDGLLYVAGHTSDNVVRYDAETGAFVDEFVAAGSGGLNAAAGLSFGPDGNLYVSSQIGDSILKYDGSTGAYLGSFVTTGSGGLDGPASISFRPDGYLYVGSYNTDSVLRYDAVTGAFVDTFVSAGSGGLNGPGALAWGPDGNLYTGGTNSVVKRFDGATGAFIDNFVTAGSGGLGEGIGLTFGPDGHLYVSSFTSDQIIKYHGATGALIGDYVAPGTGGLDGPAVFTFLPNQQVTVSSPNGAPVITSDGGATTANLNVAENTIAVTTVTTTDPDGDQIEYTISGGADAALFDIDRDTGVLTFKVVPNFETPADFDADNVYEVEVQADDQLGGTDTQILSVTVDNANDNPSVIDLHGDVLNYTEADGAVLLEEGGNASVSDEDSADFAGGSLTVEADFGLVPTEDVFSIRNQGTGAGQIGVTGSDVTYGGVVIGSFVGGTGLDPLTITFNSNAIAASVTAVVRNITYENLSLENPTAGELSVTIDITDGDGGATSTQNLTVNVVAVNDQAFADLNGSDGGGRGYSTTFTEGGGAVNVTDVDATINDVDDTDYQSIGVNLSGFVDGASEEVTVAGYTFTFGVGEVVVRTVGSTDFELDFDGSGFTITRNLGGNISQSDLQTLIRGITYENTSGAPTLGSRTVDIIPEDGSGLNGLTSTATITVFNPAAEAATDLSSGVELNTNGGNDAYFAAVDASFLDGSPGHTYEVTFSGLSVPVGQSTFYSHRDPGTAQSYLAVHADGTLDWAGVTTSGTYAQLFDGGLHSLAVTWTALTGAIDFYVDGAYVESASVAPQPAGIGGMTLVLGQHVDFATGTLDPDEAFQGTFHDTRIWDHARSAIEIAEHDQYSFDATNIPVGLLANWRMDTLVGGVTLVDLVNPGTNDLTLMHAAGVGFVAGTADDQLRVTENAANGTRVGFMRATDPDFSDTHTFSLVDDAGGRFAINSITGEITVADGTRLDFEAATSHDVTVRVTDTDALSYDEVSTILVSDIFDPAPDLDLDEDGSTAPDANFATTWNDGGGPVAVADTDATLTDGDSANLTSLTVTITNRFDGSAELLAADTIGTSIVASYNTASGVLTLSGTDSVANYQQVLRTVTYDSTHSTPYGEARVLEFVASDGTNSSAVASTTITMNVSQGVLIVTNLSDTVNGDTSSIDNLIASQGGDGISLREALLATGASANGTGPDVIRFDVTGPGPHTIVLGSALPDIAEAVIIDGASEPDYAGTPIVELDGTSVTGDGLRLIAGSDGSTIRGLVINRFDGNGVTINSDNNTIAGNYIGLDATGMTDLGNSGYGVFANGTSNNTFGGNTAADRNIIAGNSLNGQIRINNSIGNHVLGNYLGVNANGDGGFVGQGTGLYIYQGSGHNIGGSTAVERNVISGSGFRGVEINQGDGVVVQGNYIGTDSTGALALGNAGAGIFLYQATNSLIGGTANGTGNLIVGNTVGVDVNDTASGNSILGNQIYSNSQLGIDLGNEGVGLNDPNDADAGSNSLQNYPVLTSALSDGATTVVIDGSIDTTASTTYRVEFFASGGADVTGHGEAERYLGFATVATDGSGDATFSANLSALVADGEFVTATATVDLGGGSYGDTSEFALNVAALVNLAPPQLDLDANDSAAAGLGFVATWTEGAGPVFVADADAVVSDVDNANLSWLTATLSNLQDGADESLSADVTGTSIVANYDSGTGILTLSGSDSVANYQQVLRTVRYDNASSSPGTTARQIDFEASDGSLSSNVAVTTLTVVAVNNPPSVTATAAVLAYTENDGAIAVDSGVVLADPDLENLTGGTVSITGGFVSTEDALVFADQLGISGSYNPGTGVLTLTGSASVADYQTALRSVSYSNASESPDTTNRVVSFQVSDGIALAGDVRTLSIASINDDPSNLGALPTDVAVLEDTLSAVDLYAIDLSDVDAGNQLITLRLSTSTGGNLYSWNDFDVTVLGSGFGTITLTGSVADLNSYLNAAGRIQYLHGTANLAGDNVDTIQVDVYDNGNTGSGGGGLIALGTVNVDITPVNDAPVRLSGVVANLLVNEDSGLTSLGLAGLGYGPGGGADEASQTLTYQVTVIPDTIAFGKIYLADGTTQVSTGLYSLAQLQGMQFAPEPDRTGGPSFFSFRAYDSGGTPNGGSDFTNETIQINITAVNDAAVLDLDADDSAATGIDFATTWTEGGGPIAVVDADVTLADVDSPNLTSLTVTISNLLDGVNEILAADTTGTSIVAAYDPATGILTLTGSDSIASYHQVLRTVSYDNGSAAPTETARTVTFVASDGTNLSSTATTTVSIVSTNDAPELSSSAANLNFTEQSPAGLAVLISVTDADSANLTAATIVISGNYEVGADVLLYTNMLGISGTWDVPTGTLTLSGTASIADYQTAIRSIAFNNTSDTPSELQRSVDITVDDGTSVSSALTRLIDINPVADGPVLSNGATGGASSEGSGHAPYHLSTISDVDSTNFDGGVMTFSIASGSDGTETLYLSGFNGVTTTGSSVYVSGVDVGTFAGGASGSPLSITFNADATVARVESVYGALALGALAGVDNPTPGVRTLEVVVTDGDGGVSNTATAESNLIPVNDDPSNAGSLPGTVTVTEDVASSIDLSAIALADPDANLGLLTLTFSTSTGGNLTAAAEPGISVAGGGTGVLTLSGTLVDLNAYLDDPGNLSYMHSVANTNGTGADSIQVSVTDNGNTGLGGGGTLVLGTISVDIAAANDAPTAIADADTAAEGATITIDLAANDTDPDDTLDLASIVIVGSPSSGSIVVNGDGTVDYTHDGSETISDSFTYNIKDATGAVSNTVTVSLTITPQNDNPVLGNNALTIGEGGTVILSGAELSATDSETAASLLQFSVSAVTGGQFEEVAFPGVATTSFTQQQIVDGDVQFVHDDGEAAPTYNVTVSDGGLTDGPLAATISFTNINDAPTAVVDADAALEGGTVTIDLALNDSDPDDGLDLTSIVIVGSPSNGSVVVNGDGTVDYTHDGSETTSDSFTYSIKDLAGANSNIVGITLTITPVDDNPLLANNALTIGEGGTVILSGSELSASDAETAAGVLQFTVTSVTGGQFEFVASPGIQTTGFSQAQIVAGSVQFVHDGGEAAPSYDVTVSDGALTAGPLAATVTFTNVNSAPLVDPDPNTSTGGEPGEMLATWVEGTGPVSVADSDAAVSDIDSPTLQALTVTITNPLDGAAELLSANTLGTSIVATYDSASATLTLLGPDSVANYQQVLRSVTYDSTSLDPDTTPRSIVFVADDGILLSTPGYTTLTITSVNNPPTAAADVAVVDEGATVRIDLAITDSDPDDGLDLASIQIVSGPLNGTIVVRADGSVDYTHDGSETTNDSFTYTIRDAAGAISNVAVVDLTVNPVNDVPTTVADGYAPTEDTPFSILAASGVLANDADAEGDALSASLLAGPTNAAAFSLNADGSFSYTPGANFDGVDSFTYLTTDGLENSTATLVTLAVVPINDAPTIGATSGVSVLFGEAQSVGAGVLSASDPDDLASQLVYTITSSPSAGHLALATALQSPINSFSQADIDTGGLVYVHDNVVTTQDSFSVTIADAAGMPGSGPVEISVAITVPPIPQVVPPVTPPTVTPPSVTPPTINPPVTPPTVNPPVTPETPLPPPRELHVVVTTSVAQRALSAETTNFSVGSGTSEAGEISETDSYERNEKEKTEGSRLAQLLLGRNVQLEQILDELRNDVQADISEQTMLVSASVARGESMALALSGGLLAIVLRSSALWAVALSSLPLWRRLDPVAILSLDDVRRRRRADEIRFAELLEDETDQVGSLLDNADTPTEEDGPQERETPDGKGD